MFAEYMDKAMQHARYEQIEDGTYFGRIPGFKGVWANQPTEEECRKELREVLEGWILLNIADASLKRCTTRSFMHSSNNTMPMCLTWPSV